MANGGKTIQEEGSISFKIKVATRVDLLALSIGVYITGQGVKSVILLIKGSWIAIICWVFRFRALKKGSSSL